MKTKLHHYCLNTRLPDDAKAYHQLADRLRAEIKAGTRGHWMNCIVTDRKEITSRNDTETVELETAHLFNNQWNTTTARVFDWFEQAEFDRTRKHIKRGHWLEITPEMQAVRRETLKCGYTGQQFPASSGLKFNETAQGLGSENLKENELYLLRLLPITEDERPPLTAEELAYLLPKYRAAQAEGAATRAGDAKRKARADVLNDYAEATTVSKKELEQATKKRDGLLWLLDRGFGTENVIYYSHTDKFSFGWRKPLTKEEKGALLDVLSEFPFEYEFHAQS